MRRTSTAVGVLVIAACSAGQVDPDRVAWAENLGWINFDVAPATGPVFTRNEGFFEGFAWSENAGWINFGDGNGPYSNQDDTDFGVNVLASGELVGFAWAENFGWINFGTVAFEPTVPGLVGMRYDADARRLRGLAWSENAGWINFNDDEKFVGFLPLCRGDVNDDGFTDLNDVLAILAMFGSDDRLADVNGDGAVDLQDILDALSGFGGCEPL